MLLFFLLTLANITFCSNKFYFIIPWGKKLSFRQFDKPAYLIITEFIFSYFIFLLFGFYFENRFGNVAPQSWQFYVIIFSLFLIAAFPGFSFRLLARRRSV